MTRSWPAVSRPASDAARAGVEGEGRTAVGSIHEVPVARLRVHTGDRRGDGERRRSVTTSRLEGTPVCAGYSSGTA